MSSLKRLMVEGDWDGDGDGDGIEDNDIGLVNIPVEDNSMRRVGYMMKGLGHADCWPMCYGISRGMNKTRE